MSPLATRRTVGVLGAALALTLPTAVAATAAVTPAHKPSIPPSVSSADYLPGVEADLYLPSRGPGRKPVPVVIMVPGGAWSSADRSGLGQLADALADEGVAVFNATYRIGDEESTFPLPVQDVRCAVDAGVAAVRDAGLRPGQVVLLGHSAGAHLSSLAALGDEEFDAATCPYPDAEIDGWVGLSGVYDLTFVGPLADVMMGGSAAELPELYAAANPESYLTGGSRHQHLDALVVQGDADEFGITADYAEGFGQTLRDHRYDTRVVIVEGGDHHATYQAPVVADTILRWLAHVER
jgi:acetyl esterase/lipase